MQISDGSDTGAGHVSDVEQTNPKLVVCVDSDLQEEFFLTPDILRRLAGTDDLHKVTSLEMTIDTYSNTIGNLGDHVPNLVKLNINGSKIASVRDLGTSVIHIEVLCMSCCHLNELDGIHLFSCLKELNLSYNNIADLSGISFLEHLQCLDLKGNNIADIYQMQHLYQCRQLNTLILQDNPVCKHPGPFASQTSKYNYKEIVRKMLPQLVHLDDVPVKNTAAQEEWNLRKELRRETHEDLERITDTYPKMSESIRAVTPSSPRSSFAGCEQALKDLVTSDLTKRRVICGNPAQALRLQRQTLNLSDVPDHTLAQLEKRDQELQDLFSELKAWRKEHNKWLMKVKRCQEAEIVPLSHNKDEEEQEEEEEEGEEGLGESLSISSEEEEDGAGRCTCTSSPDSLQSPPPGQHLPYVCGASQHSDLPSKSLHKGKELCHQATRSPRSPENPPDVQLQPGGPTEMLTLINVVLFPWCKSCRYHITWPEEGRQAASYVTAVM